MVSTIQLNENVKKTLQQMKERKNESYEETIVKLIKSAEKQKQGFEELMKEGYKEMKEELIKINNEFKYADAEIDWEWDES